jgi:hypothetical protein
VRLERLDLHGYTVADAMLRFVRVYNGLLGARTDGELRGLEVVHGKGKGDTPSLIRDALRDYLREHGKRISGFDTQLVLRGADYLLDKYPGDLTYILGEDATRNGGCTIVIPRKRLRTPHDWLGYRY